MKFIWEEKDVEAGRRVNNPQGSREMMIGYRYDDTAQRQPAIFTVIALDDGLEVFHATLKQEAPLDIGYIPGPSGSITKQITIEVTARAQIARWLNEAGAVPMTLGLR